MRRYDEGLFGLPNCKPNFVFAIYEIAPFRKFQLTTNAKCEISVVSLLHGNELEQYIACTEATEVVDFKQTIKCYTSR